MSDPQSTQQQDQTLTTIVAAASAVVLAAFMGAQLALLTKFATLIATYGMGDLLRFALRRAAKDVATQLQSETPALVAQVIGRAAFEGSRAAGPGEPVKPSFGVAGDSFESHAERSARAIREDLTGKLNGLGYRITRYADDIYQAVQVDAGISQVLGATPATAQADAYRALTRRGVDGFTDSRGRKWELSAYVDMAVRTAAQRAFNVSHLDRMRSLGITLFTVSDDGHPCPLCAPWQGKVLSVEPDDRADATIADATAAGLFHPRCRHTLVAFFPGVIPAPHEWNAEDQRLYDESQRQRKLERDIRAAKRELAGAYTPEQKTRAQFAVRQAQAAMRTFIDSTGRVRNTRREQLNLGAK
jgi:hypothetical protein